MVKASGSLVVPVGFRRDRLGQAQLGIVLVEGRALGADRFGIGTHVDEDVRVIERRKCPDAHELPGAHLDCGKAHLVLKMGSCARCHVILEMLVSRAD